MCLESTRFFPRIAKEDIVVGKELYVSGGELVTAIREYPITSILLKTNSWLFAILKLLFKLKCHGRYIIEGGMFHSYNLDQSCSYFKEAILEGTVDGRRLYVKAIIPKGALYYKDYWGHTYASNKLILQPSKEQLKYFKCDE